MRFPLVAGSLVVAALAPSPVRVDVTFRADAAGLVEAEHCRFSAARRDAFGFGRQVLISGSTAALPNVNAGLCTVDSVAHTRGANVVLLSASDFRDRLEASSGTVRAGYVTNTYLGAPAGVVAAPIERKVTATTDPGLGEYWRLPDAGSAPRVAYTAPHGGEIEPGTNEQVVALDVADDDPRNAYWSVLGAMNAPDGSSGGAHDHWHITSTDLFSFRGLAALRAQRYAHAVAFHGFSDGDIAEDVIVGGAETFRLRAAVAQVIDHEVAVRHDRFDLDSVAPPADCGTGCPYRALAGASPDNFVNAITTSGRGLQLEQTRPARDVHGPTIARAVKSVFDCLHDPADEQRPAARQVALSDVGKDLSSGTCPYFVGEVRLAGASALRWRVKTSVDCGPAGCAGTLGRLDAFARRADRTWAHVGGGALRPGGSGIAAVLTSHLALPVPVSSHLRFVVRAATVAAAPAVLRGLRLDASPPRPRGSTY